ncbi:MAG: cysteine--tRNA ligase [Anaerorhabdus sp.]
MKLYNTKTLKKEVFKPLIEGEVSIYVCGPTVYNHAHIGNARPLVIFDLLHRLFLTLNYKVKFVSNYTDIDDRIIATAKEKNVSESEISEKYIDAYEKLCKSLNIIEDRKVIRVTDVMDAIIKYIKNLVDSGYAYESDGDVFFIVDKLSDYGSLSHQVLDDLNAGARVSLNEVKRNPLDFALWKKTDDGIRWDSPWSKGRPGWHTECVVMIFKEFNKYIIDIHGGGQDLKFPHHENEVAQCRALHHSDLANFFIHNGMVNINNEKMSKSLGNFKFAKDVIEVYGSNLVRWFLLSTHYRKDLNFTDEALQMCQNEFNKINTAIKQATLVLSLNNVEIKEINNDNIKAFIEYLCDDLNTPNAYMEINAKVKQLNQLLRSKEKEIDAIANIVSELLKMLWIIGVSVEVINLSDDQKEMYQKWLRAKTEKNFDEADKYRLRLVDEGIL